MFNAVKKPQTVNDIFISKHSLCCVCVMLRLYNEAKIYDSGFFDVV